MLPTRAAGYTLLPTAVSHHATCVGMAASLSVSHSRMWRHDMSQPQSHVAASPALSHSRMWLHDMSQRRPDMSLPRHLSATLACGCMTCPSYSRMWLLDMSQPQSYVAASPSPSHSHMWLPLHIPATVACGCMTCLSHSGLGLCGGS